jgi:hypothetical protein
MDDAEVAEFSQLFQVGGEGAGRGLGRGRDGAI